MSVNLKDPVKVRAGQIGANARWGPPRVVRLDELTPDQRRVVVAMLEAAKKAAPADASAGAADAAEVTTHDHAAG